MSLVRLASEDLFLATFPQKPYGELHFKKEHQKASEKLKQTDGRQ